MTTFGELFDYLNNKLSAGENCDNTLRLTKAFAKQQRLDVDELTEELERCGGFCDCEVLLNAMMLIPCDRHIE
jgi:hypothetical protein